jgi:hypothetical protein
MFERNYTPADAAVVCTFLALMVIWIVAYAAIWIWAALTLVD